MGFDQGAHVQHQRVLAGVEPDPVTAMLPLSVAAVVVDDLVAVDVQQ